MHRRIFRVLSAIVLVAGFLTADAQAEDKIDFRKEIFPIFESSCFACHGEEQQMGELRLDAKANALEGGVSGPSIVPGSAQASPLVRRISHAEGVNPMPMGSEKLSESQINRIRAWIDQGAEWPENVGLEQAEVSRHWAFVSPQRPTLPAVRDEEWARNPIDRFVLARLEKEGLSPAPEADRLKLLRRGGSRPGWPSPDNRGSRRLCGGQRQQGLREANQPFARLAALRRALGTSLARRGALRRLGRL